MKKTACLILCLLFVFITGCSPESRLNYSSDKDNFHSESSENKDNGSLSTEQSVIQGANNGTDVLKAMDITNIIKLVPLNDNEIYIIGAKRDDAFEQREIVYGALSLEEKKATVFHREFISIDGAENSAVQINNDGLTEFFTGQKILILDGYNLIDIQPVAVGKKESFVDLKQKELAVIENENLVLYLKSLDESDEKQTVICEPEKYNKNGKESTLFPFSPKIYEDKIIYGIAEDDTMYYKKIVISDFGGGIISETGDLEVKADHIFFYFKEDGFITIETADSLPDGTEKEVTFFTEYSNNGKSISEQAVSGIYLDGQGKMYDGCSLYAYAYSNDSDSGIAVYDFYKKAAYKIRAAEGYVISPTVTPSGKRIVWAHNGMIFFEDINNTEERESIENIK